MYSSIFPSNDSSAYRIHDTQCQDTQKAADRTLHMVTIHPELVVLLVNYYYLTSTVYIKLNQHHIFLSNYIAGDYLIISKR